MNDCQSLREQTLVYADFVKAFLVAVRDSEEADRNPLIAASASVARERFEILQNDLDQVWTLYLRTRR